MFVGGVIALLEPLAGLTAVFGFAAAVWIGATAAAPVKQRNEAWSKCLDLENARKTSVDFNLNPNCIWLEKNIASISVGVRNNSDIQINDVFVELDRFVDGIHILNLPRKLRPRDEDGPKFDLPPRRTQYVMVAQVKMEHGSRIEYQFIDKKNNDVTRTGEYTIKLKVFGDSIQPINRFFSLTVNEDCDDIRFDNIQFHTGPNPRPD